MPIALMLVGGALVALGVAYLRRPGASVESAAAEAAAALSGTLRLSSEQTAMVDVIGREFIVAGLGWLVVPAVVNAYAESKLDPRATGDGGASLGLFQLHEAGAGAGIPDAERLDPAGNTRGIIAEIGRRGLPAPGATNADLTAWFARDIERCAACGHQDGTSELDRRARLLVQLYGSTVAAAVPR